MALLRTIRTLPSGRRARSLLPSSRSHPRQPHSGMMSCRRHMGPLKFLEKTRQSYFPINPFSVCFHSRYQVADSAASVHSNLKSLIGVVSRFLCKLFECANMSALTEAFHTTHMAQSAVIFRPLTEWISRRKKELKREKSEMTPQHFPTRTRRPKSGWRDAPNVFPQPRKFEPHFTSDLVVAAGY